MELRAYATVEQADEYLMQTPDADVWAASDNRRKRMALIGASVAINSLETYCGGLIGRRLSPDQPLAFPRTGQAAVPDVVVMACCHEAAQMLADWSDGTAKRRRDARRQGVTGVSLGAVSESYAANGDDRRERIGSDAAWALLAPLMRQPGVHGIR